MSPSLFIPWKESDMSSVPMECSFDHRKHAEEIPSPVVAAGSDGRRGKRDEEQMMMHLPIEPPPRKRICLTQAVNGCVHDADCHSAYYSDSDSESDYDCYYDDLPTVEKREELNNYYMEEMILAAGKACKDSGDGLELEDLQLFKVNVQGTGTKRDCYIIFRGKGSFDGKSRCYVAQVISICDYDADPFKTWTVEFVRLIDDPSQVTASEWPAK